MSFEPIQNLIPRAAASYGITTELNAAGICQQFRNLVPELFKNKPHPAKHIQPAHFKDGTLTVNVENQSWGQEVIMRKSKIIKEINSKAGKQVIKSLITQLTPIDSQPC